MNILITAFDPFGGEPVNPSQQILALLPDQIGEHQIHKLVIPTIFREAGARVAAEMDRLHPDVVLSLGQAGGRAPITIERVAVNLMDAGITDNRGYRPVDETIEEEGPAAYFATVPVKAMAEAINAIGVPAKLSYSAGVFVCNSVLYGALHHAAQTMPAVRCGFIHVPFLPEQTAQRADKTTPSMPLEDMVRGIQAAVAAI